MKLRIGDYLDCKIKSKGINKKELYEKLKECFHLNENYVQYKGFTSRFYGKLYAEDLLEISYLLGIDLNKMRDELMDRHKSDASIKVQEALLKSKYKVDPEKYFSRWSCVDSDFVYIVWFKININNDLIDVRVEMYDLNKEEIIDISYLTYLAIKEMDKEWKNKTFDDKMNTIKNLNKSFHDNLNNRM